MAVWMLHGTAKIAKIVNMSKSETGVVSDSVSATRAKNEFGRILEKVMRGGRVVITKHDSPKAILISIEEFDALMGEGKSKLDALTKEFDAMLRRMQTQEARSGMKAAFGATPKDLGKTAVIAAGKRGRSR